eukprot:2066674-Rhodomonas_salina.3
MPCETDRQYQNVSVARQHRQSQAQPERAAWTRRGGGRRGGPRSCAEHRCWECGSASWGAKPALPCPLGWPPFSASVNACGARMNAGSASVNADSGALFEGTALVSHSETLEAGGLRADSGRALGAGGCGQRSDHHAARLAQDRPQEDTPGLLSVLPCDMPPLMMDLRILVRLVFH